MNDATYDPQYQVLVPADGSEVFPADQEVPADGSEVFPADQGVPADGSEVFPAEQGVPGEQFTPAIPAEPATPLLMGESIQAPLAGSEPAEYDPAVPAEPATPLLMGDRIQAPLAGSEPAEYDPATPAEPAIPSEMGDRILTPADGSEVYGQETPRLLDRMPVQDDTDRAYESTGPDDQPGAYESTGPGDQPGAYESTPPPAYESTPAPISGSTSPRVFMDTDIINAGIPAAQGLAHEAAGLSGTARSDLDSLQLNQGDPYSLQFAQVAEPMTQQLLDGLGGFSDAGNVVAFNSGAMSRNFQGANDETTGIATRFGQSSEA